jgi:ribonucleoside-diphosphate reductase alpha chain
MNSLLLFENDTKVTVVNGSISEVYLSDIISPFVDFLHKYFTDKRELLSVIKGFMYNLYDLISKAKNITNAHDLYAIAVSLIWSNEKTRVAVFDYYRSKFGGIVSDIQPLFVVKRDGRIVQFDEQKIYNAIRKAFMAARAEYSDEEIYNVIKKVIVLLGKQQVFLEDIQDAVIYVLIFSNHIDVANAYVMYRANRAKLRILEDAYQSLENSVRVLEDNGVVSVYNVLSDVSNRVHFAMQGLKLDKSHEDLVKFLAKDVYDGIKRRDLQASIILNAKALTELHYNYSIFAGRILLTYIYEETIGFDFLKHNVERLNTFYRRAFHGYVKRGIDMGILDHRLLEFDLKKLAQSIDYRYDTYFTLFGLQTLYDRYFIVDKSNKKHVRIEAPQFFWMRVAMGLNILEKENKEQKTLELFDKYRKRLFCSSTPTLYNSGTVRPQLSSCYLYKVEDSIESIMQRGIADCSYLSKWAGGLGGSWTAVRGTGAFIKGTNGESNGVIPFLKIHNDMLVAVNQGGKRNGSGCAYLEVWHNDIFEFCELRRNTGDERRRTHDMNTAVWIPDLFMKRVLDKKHWTLFRSNEVSDLHELYGKAFEEKYVYYEKLAEEGKIWGKRIEAIELWKHILRMLYETGHPWITFKDPCNIRSPQDHVGVIHSSNLCTEITLNTSMDEIAVCNLGSVVLENHLKEDGYIDWDLLRDTIRVAIRALDNVIDINFYPVNAAKNSNLRHRPIGLGVMGWHYMLMAMGIDFESEKALELMDELMEFIAYEAYSASVELAKEKGPYSTFKGSKWDRGLLPLDTLELLEKERGYKIEVGRRSRLNWDDLRERIKKYGIRNSNVLAIAPTATISNIMGSSPSIEPLYSNMYVKSNLSGDFMVINPFLCRDLEKLGLWKYMIIMQIKANDGDISNIPSIPEHLKKRYKTAFQIDQKWIIDMAAIRQKWIDQSQSINIFYSGNSLKEISDIYVYAWKKGLKTTYYLRTLGASAIEKATVSKSKIVNNYDGEICEACQ